ncbi:MAG: hypothetical protein LM550_17040, partial [Candidatus Contendobacter sp.]|nr:hypothetical protein [Candidatus Contendobacter sp.]
AQHSTAQHSTAQHSTAQHSTAQVVFLCVSLLLVIIISGIRFSDGSMLLAIARGATVDNSVFTNSAAQYVWDSPLKIITLQLLPAKIIIIALAFGFLGILPLIGIISKDYHKFWIAFVVVFLTPAFKVSIQNMGVGDGFVVFLIIIMSLSRSFFLVAVPLFLIAIWHPQQSFFIGISYLLARYCYVGELNKKELVTVFGSLGIAALIFFFYKSTLSFSYSGREVYMASRINELLHHNLIYAPIAFAPIIFWFLLSGVRVKKGTGLLSLWLCGLAFVSLLTTDVTRVMTIISLPIVTLGANNILIDKVVVPPWKFVFGGTLIALIPPFSWSGFDYFLWKDLISDFCKWGVHCW